MKENCYKRQLYTTHMQRSQKRNSVYPVSQKDRIIWSIHATRVNIDNESLPLTILAYLSILSIHFLARRCDKDIFNRIFFSLTNRYVVSYPEYRHQLLNDNFKKFLFFFNNKSIKPLPFLHGKNNLVKVFKSLARYKFENNFIERFNQLSKYQNILQYFSQHDKRVVTING